MASRYDLLSYDAEEERVKSSQDIPIQNLIAAAWYMASRLQERGIPYAFMGGFAMMLRGSQRSTQDVDMIVDATMKTIWEVIEPLPRLIIPNSKLVSGIIKLFVRTGPEWGLCAESHEIEVDLTLPGVKGSPRNLKSNVEPLTFMDASSGQQVVLKGLNVLYMLRSKMGACYGRSMDRDYSDITWLIESYPDEVQRVCEHLDLEHVEYFLESIPEDTDRGKIFRKLLNTTDD